MDVLSEVLRVVKLQGALYFNAEFSAPWCFHSARSTDITSLLSPAAEHVITFHFLTEGRAFAQLADGRREEMIAGDIIVFPHGDGHVIGNGSAPQTVDAWREFAKHVADGLKLVRFGGGGEPTRFVCGFLACDPRLSQVFLSGLPPMLKVHVANEPAGQWLKHSIRFSVDQVCESNSGSGLVLAKLSEVLFVETLRRYITTLPADQTGWLAGARDASIGQALSLLHKEPSHAWTISNLARRVGLSRTRLAERFRHFLGESPMAYLAQWRLKLGAEILGSTEDSVASVARSVGYGSEAAFNRAFKREFDCPPAQFRRKRNAPRAKAASVSARSLLRSPQ